MSALILALILALGLACPALAAPAVWRDGMKTAARAVSAAPPQVGATGGEWAVLGLARSGLPAPDAWFADYLRALEETLQERQGVLHPRKQTEYARVALALFALGCDPRDVASYDLLAPLTDREAVGRQGLNGMIWALLALDCSGVPDAQVSEARAYYLEELLSRQLPNGGFALSGQAAETDLTAMALQALARYRGQERADEAIARALSCLSGLQTSGGGFAAQGVENAESVSQVILALCQLGLSPEEPSFGKSGVSPLENLMSFYLPGQGFSHLAGEGVSAMATEQALCALAATARQQEGLTPFYTMESAAPAETPAGESALPAEDLSPALPLAEAWKLSLPAWSGLLLWRLLAG